MLISIINNTQLQKDEVQQVIRSINRQLAEDFKRYWHRDVEVRLEGWTGEQPNPETPLDMRGDAVIYLWDQEDLDDALGYHDLTGYGVPYGFVFTKLSESLGEPWSVTFSHEVLELAMDPEVNLLAQGPHPDPDQASRTVYHWYELCDAVQADSYEIDGVKVSNFVLPLYFTEGDEHQNHNDFLGSGVSSFDVAPGGYVGFFDPETGRHETYERRGDRVAEERREKKVEYGAAQRVDRHKGGESLAAIDDDNLVRCEAVVFELDGDATDAAAIRGRAEQLVRTRLGTEWSVEPAAGDPNEFDAVYNGAKGLRFSAGWEIAHSLTDDASVVYAEPSLTYPVVGETDAAEEIASGSARAAGRGSRHLEGTEDPGWGLQQTRVNAAWRFIEDAGKNPGEDVRIGHPDSGYRPHLEMDQSRVLTGIDYDFQGRDEETSSKKGNHGLSTASVIMSGRGGASDRIQGPALHSEIVPLRVTKPGWIRPAPVLIGGGMRRLRDAIDYAGRVGCGVISMSLGGLPSRAVQKAVHRATDRGCIVLAAAGNEVRLVVWPARYDEVIAVAGSNIEREAWRGSSRGSSVDITAPAESVWRAIYDDERPSVARGNGTSFAVALTAGVAAIWLSYHGHEKLKKRYGADQVHRVFRDLLQETARQDHRLPAGQFGAGILNAEELLKQALPERPGRARAAGRAKRDLREEIREEVRRAGLDTRLGIDAKELSSGLAQEILCADVLGAFEDSADSEGLRASGRGPRTRTAALSKRLRGAL